MPDSSSRELQAFIDALPDAALLIDAEGTVLVANQKVRGELGLAPEESRPFNLFAALPPEQAVDLKQMVDEVLATSRPVRFVTSREGRTIANHLLPVLDPGGKVARLALLSLDRTELEEWENRLRDAQKLEALGTLSAGIAHEFNNVLTAIVGHASLLDLKLGQNSPLREHIAPILQVSERATALTTSLLTFSRQRLHQPLSMDINLILRGLHAMIGPLLGKEIALELKLGEGSLHAKVDPGLLEQAFLNLALNAKDAMPQGGTLTITLENVLVDQAFLRSLNQEGSPGRYALITISDTGEGMDKELLSRIFEPFFTTKELGRGIGLGLPVTLGIIHQHRGLLTVDSEPGKGSTFHIYLPLMAANLPRGDSAAAVDENRAPGREP